MQLNFASPHIIADVSLSRTPKSLDGKHLTLLHLISILVFDEWYLFASMNMIPQDIMTSDVSDSFHWKGLPADFNLVAFHDLLDRGPDITHSRVNPCFLYYPSATMLHQAGKKQTHLDSSIGSLLYCSE